MSWFKGSPHFRHMASQSQRFLALSWCLQSCRENAVFCLLGEVAPRTAYLLNKLKFSAKSEELYRPRFVHAPEVPMRERPPICKRQIVRLAYQKSFLRAYQNRRTSVMLQVLHDMCIIEHDLGYQVHGCDSALLKSASLSARSFPASQVGEG